MNAKAKEIIKYFETLRFDPKHHLGLGDIRLTIGQQEEIISMVNKIISNKEANRRKG